MTENKLQETFPMLRSAGEVLLDIYNSRILKAVFNSWDRESRQEFVDFVTGERGVRMLYKGFFRELFNPEIHPGRLDDLLSTLLKKKVHVLQVLPGDIKDPGKDPSPLLMNILLELEDHYPINVEIFRVGCFLGEDLPRRSGDMLLERWLYEDVRRFCPPDVKVYPVLLLGRSTPDFRVNSDQFLRHIWYGPGTDLRENTLPHYLFVSLANFQRIRHDLASQKKEPKSADKRLHAWLLFLASDEPEDILGIIEEFPEFRELYEDVYRICRNTEDAMSCFLEEPRISERATTWIKENDLLLRNDKAQEQAYQLQRELEQLKGGDPQKVSDTSQ